MKFVRRGATALLTSAAVVATSVQLIAAPAHAAALPNVGVSAAAYGSYSAVGSTVKSCPVAYAGISCTTTFGRTVTGTAATATTAAIGSVGATSTSASTAVETAAKVTRSSARTGAVNLLGGQVRANAVTAATSASVSTASTYAGTNSSQLAGLVVAGRSLSATPAPNTAITLRDGAGTVWGTVYLNRQSKQWSGQYWTVTTTALQVVVSAKNPVGAPVGANVVVGRATSTLTKPVTGLVGGYGHSTSANAANGSVLSSRTALAAPGCAGGSNTATVAAASVPGVVSTGTTTTDATSTVSTTSRSVRVVNRTATPRILAGLVSADAVVADTQASQALSTASPALADRSAFVGLKIANLPAVADSVKPNTVLTVPGLGKVTLHKVTRGTRSIEVVMIEVVTDRVLGSLPTGSVIRVGVASSSLA